MDAKKRKLVDSNCADDDVGFNGNNATIRTLYVTPIKVDVSNLFCAIFLNRF